LNIKEKVKNLPSSPGIYLMRDSLDNILYVGKSKNLKQRVQSYFQNSKSHPPKIKKLVKNLKDFEYILTDTEFEAFMLECEYIKKLKPIYNKLMKSPLSYTYVKIQIDDRYSNIEITSIFDENDCNLYFGPYTNKSTVERAIRGIKEYYKILCSNPSKKNTACLNYSLGLCIGMCLGGPAAEQYHNIVGKIAALLNGTDMSILKEMEEKMLSASEKFDFETAAKYRDYIDAVNTLIHKGEVIDFTEESKNIVMIEKLNDRIIKLFLVKRNKVLFSEKYKLQCTDINQLNAVIKSNILTHFNTTTFNLPIEVRKDEIDEAQIIYSYLKSSNCNYIIIPKEWLDSEYNANIDEALNKLLGFEEQNI
jgi:excinuclease ABC subunit C